MVRGLVGALLALLLAGCGGGAAGQDSDRSAFVLHVWDESLVGASADGFYYSVQYTDDGWATVEIDVNNARDLRSLYFDLQYDPSHLEPAGVDFYDRIAPPDLRIEQIKLNTTPGSVFASEVAGGVSPAGYTGTGHLARVLFRRK